MKVHVTGREHLDPNQTYVFISNHRSYLDTATLFAYTGRRLGLLAKKELLNVPILGYGMGFVNVMAIDRSNSERARQTVEAATERIRSGISFGVFAEGTRAKPGEFLPFKKGAFYMAAQAGVPIVPVAIKNTDYLDGKGNWRGKTGNYRNGNTSAGSNRGCQPTRTLSGWLIAFMQLSARNWKPVNAELPRS